MSEEKLSAPDPNQFHELTICSVSFGSAEYLMSNWRLAKALNGEGLKKWIVIENSPAACETRLTTSSSPFSVVEGTEFDSNHPTPASRHHGLALNKALGSVRTRFLLMMDPDFYIVRKHWIQCVLKHMDQQELAFFGVPWHPRWSNGLAGPVQIPLLSLSTLPLYRSGAGRDRYVVLDHSGRSFPIHWSQKRERGRVIAMSAPLASRDHQRTSLARASGFPTLNSGSRDLIRKQGTIQKEVVYVLPALLLGTLLPPSRKPSHQRGILRLLSIGLILFSIFAFVRNANINVAVAGSVTPFLRGSLRTLAAH